MWLLNWIEVYEEPLSMGQKRITHPATFFKTDRFQAKYIELSSKLLCKKFNVTAMVHGDFHRLGVELRWASAFDIWIVWTNRMRNDFVSFDLVFLNDYIPLT